MVVLRNIYFEWFATMRHNGDFTIPGIPQCLSPSSELGPPTPLSPQASVSSPPGTKGGGATFAVGCRQGINLKVDSCFKNFHFVGHGRLDSILWFLLNTRNRFFYLHNLSKYIGSFLY
jgi:hypothetical protein